MEIGDKPSLINNANAEVESSGLIEYLNNFRSCQEYKTALEAYLANPKRENVKANFLNDEMRPIIVENFENTPSSQDAFIKFNQSTPLTDEAINDLPPDFISNLNLYHRAVHKMGSFRTDQEELAELDAFRSSKHTALANMLVTHGICPSYGLARVLVSAIHQAKFPGSDGPEATKKNLQNRRYSLGIE